MIESGGSNVSDEVLMRLSVVLAQPVVLAQACLLLTP